MPVRSRLVLIAGVALGSITCDRGPSAPRRGDPPELTTPGSAAAARRSTRPPQANAARSNAEATSEPTPDTAPGGVDVSPYPWHADGSLQALPAVDHLDQRIAPPAGFVRVPLEPGSFGAWLRHLPLAAPGTPVRSYRGGVLLPADHANVAAVTTLDVGRADLQQCADAVMRLHAEWAWSKGRRDMTYRAAAGTPLPYARWARGERVKLRGRSLHWEPSGRASDDHGEFRKYLDAVFSWANTVSLAKQAAPVALDELRPGDFLILPGNPGHTVLVLDRARHPDGRQVVLLGQSYMPAQSFQVLRPSRDQTWFAVEPAADGIQTPFWPAPFPWSSLRRLDTPQPPGPG